MFEQYSTDARRVVARAVDEARALGHHPVGTEHLLLAMTLLEGHPVREALVRVGLTTEAVRASVGEPRPPEARPDPLSPEEALELGEQLKSQGVPRQRIREIVDRIQRERSGELELSDPLKRVLGPDVRESDEVGPGDLLRALLGEPSPEVARILYSVGLEPEDALRRIEDPADAD